jgi:hypothetical protein
VLGGTRTNLFNLNRDGPATLRGVLSHGSHLQRQRLQVVRGHARIKAGSEHFRRFLALPKTLFGFAFSDARLAVTSRCPMRKASS